MTVCPGVAAQNWTALNTLTLLSAQTLRRRRDTVRLTELPGTSPCGGLGFTWQSPGGGWRGWSLCDDVIQANVRGEWGLAVLVLGGCTLTTGNISARYTTAESPGGQQQH